MIPLFLLSSMYLFPIKGIFLSKKKTDEKHRSKTTMKNKNRNNGTHRFAIVVAHLKHGRFPPLQNGLAYYSGPHVKKQVFSSPISGKLRPRSW